MRPRAAEKLASAPRVHLSCTAMTAVKGLQRDINILLDREAVDWEKIRNCRGLPGITLDWRDLSTKITVLHRAAYDGQVDILEWAVKDKKHPIDSASTIGRTPLHFAADGGHARAIKVLLDAKADINITSLGGSNALHIACRNHKAAAVEALLNSGQDLDIDAEDESRKTPEMLTNDSDIKRHFRMYRSRLKKQREMNMMRAAGQKLFAVFDEDGDGWISPAEFTKVHAAMVECFTNSHPTPDDCDALFKEADKNADGKISFDEFVTSQSELLAALEIPVQDLVEQLDKIKGALKSGPPCTLSDVIPVEQSAKEDFRVMLRNLKLPEEIAKRFHEDAGLQALAAKCSMSAGPRKAVVIKGPGNSEGVKVRTSYNDTWAEDVVEAVEECGK